MVTVRLRFVGSKNFKQFEDVEDLNIFKAYSVRHERDYLVIEYLKDVVYVEYDTKHNSLTVSDNKLSDKMNECNYF